MIRVKTQQKAGLVLILFLLLWPLAGVSSTEAPVYDRYTLHASANASISNDLMTVLMVIEDEDADNAVLADRINQDMLWALLQLESYPSIKTHSREYTTYPKYEHNRINAWHISQTLSLEGADFDAIKTVVASLQERLTVRSMTFSPKIETRKMAEDKLISEALSLFKQRSSLIQESMGHEKYRVIHLSIDSNNRGGGPLPVYRESMSMSRSSSMAVTAPSVDAGKSNISVSVHGEIQLQ
jgi:predicted secreted protein